jgi:peptidyl-tRNA hydrolase
MGRMLEHGADPTGEAPWALPIVVRAEKASRPDATAVAEAVAIAVVRLLDDERSACGEWASPVRRWLDGRIRKVARRARGSRWDAVAALPGVTVTHRGATVRVLLPTPTDSVPPQIGKLQVAGLELPVGSTSPVRDDALPVALNPHITMTPLKAAVQAAHAAQLAREALTSPQSQSPSVSVSRWRAAGFDVRLVRPDAVTWARWAPTAEVVVRDAGFTEVPPGTRTAIALWTDDPFSAPGLTAVAAG